MTPREHDIIETAVWLVDAIFGRVHRMLGVGIDLEGLGIDTFIRKCATDNKGILQGW